MRGRPDVGLGDVCVSDSLSGYHNTDTLARESTIAKLSAKFAARGSGAVSERSGGVVKPRNQAWPNIFSGCLLHHQIKTDGLSE